MHTFPERLPGAIRPTTSSDEEDGYSDGWSTGNVVMY